MTRTSAEIASLLRCPITRGPLTPLKPDELDEANRLAAAGALRRRDGTPVADKIESGFAPSSGRFFYPVVDGILALLPDSAIFREAPGSRPDGLRDEKRRVRDFYDQTGWQPTPEGLFSESARFGDLRAVTEGYHRNCEERLLRRLPAEGGILLDAGSGPAQNIRDTGASRRFRTRICVDLSRVGLLAAKSRIGDRGIYIQADVADLPLADGCVDAAVCLHVLQHLPPDEQGAALRGLHRVLKPHGRALVVYAWGYHSYLMNIATLPYHLIRIVKDLYLRHAVGRPQARIYFDAHGYRWFRRQTWGFPLEIASWRSLSTPFLKCYVHGGWGGERILRLAVALEDRFPHLMGVVGHYPLFIIEKA
ncbi:MAG: class I SAM-dependent methyltransferase [Elusimicrobia bacterium]|nr:class I SAM-dependent methyltransferase [Elusimicrobiota bacterium]